jgi:flavin-dependent thymidylate synthase
LALLPPRLKTIQGDSLMEHINGKLEIQLLAYTQNADRMLVFSKRTRHMSGVTSWEELNKMDSNQFAAELDYALNSISSALEFVDYTFLIYGVTRGFTHQLVRHRVGVSFAQQSMRLATQEDFGYMIPDDIQKDSAMLENYIDCMEIINKNYSNMLGNGANPQDARGVLPTNILTNILMKINLRALVELLGVRLCIRTQGEFQEVAKRLQSEVVRVHPWSDRLFGPACLINGVCKYRNYEGCPISRKFPQLLGLSKIDKTEISKLFGKVSGFDPQPKAQKVEPELNANHHDGVESKIFP